METKEISRIALGTFLITAGVGHLTFARKEFQAQVPDWVPLKKDDAVIYSGIAEILLGTTIIATPKKHRKTVGKVVATFLPRFYPEILLSIRTGEILLALIPTTKELRDSSCRLP
ncbi:DoxX family protein [Chryseobacterium carnipullorum]|uniref:Predicted membrane protein n=1 Tax=Chryseobacterium carnipullorum TaxID=1124835 RepID=A0A376DV69_CHRCU|nr:hypothetical protein [Chryseobacterium carnipullorum]STC95773.1 Predicted membrane protein [Chryseobacterium carnipullorum]